jgi:serine/threonine-protein kinase
MGVLYRARDTRLDRVVALKVMSAEVSEDPVFRRRFAEEARLAAAIDHPNVIPVYESGEHEGQLFIAMRFVTGTSLRELIRAESPMALPRVVGLLGQMAAALDAVHRAGLVHRDVKPDNLLIEPASSPGKGEHLYLVDFGLSRSDARSRLTQTGQIVGTVAYASPEQLHDSAVSAATDVYSLGCVLYEMLTGVRPFQRSNDAAVVYAHLSDPPPPASSVRAELPGEVDAVVAKAMAKEPGSRYQSAGEVASAFAAAAGLVTVSPAKVNDDAPTVMRGAAAREGSPSDSGGRSGRSRSRSPSRRSLVMLTTSVVVATVLGVAAVLVDWSGGAPGDLTAPTPSDTAPTRSDTRGPDDSGPGASVALDALPVSRMPPVTLQHHLASVAGGGRIEVRSVLKNLSPDHVAVGISIGEQRAIRVLGPGGEESVPLAFEVPGSPIRTEEGLRIWGEGRLDSPQIVWLVRRCDQVGSEGDDVIDQQAGSVVCALGGDDRIRAPDLSRWDATDDALELNVRAGFGEIGTYCLGQDLGGEVLGGDGTDLVSFERVALGGGVSADLHAGNAFPRASTATSPGGFPGKPFYCFAEVEALAGSPFADLLGAPIGGEAPSPLGVPEGVELDGGPGNDQLAGWASAAVLDGGSGEDQCFSDNPSATIVNCEESGPTPPFLPPPPG